MLSLYFKQVYIKDELPGLIDEFGMPHLTNPKGELGPKRYIEAQIWDKTVILEILKDLQAFVHEE